MRPMLATPGDLPTGPEWAFEVKWDGMRLLADIHDGVLRLTSRAGRDVTTGFPELAAMADAVPDALLDGELVVLGEDGAPDFEALAPRIGITGRARAARLAATAPATYLVFDLLRLDGESLVDRPYLQRRRALATLPLRTGRWQVPETFADGPALWRATGERGLEGVVAKRWDSPYSPGVRSPDWIKRSHRDLADATVVGWREAAGRVVSLALAQPDDAGGWLFRGTAGSGISGAKSGVLRQLLTAQAAAGPAEADVVPQQDAARLDGFHWVRPGVTVEVSHLGLSASGRFRQPVVERVRPDLAPAGGGRSGGASGGRVGDSDPDAAVRVAVAGRVMRITHLDKVLYPATGTTKAEVIEYYTAVAGHLLPLAADRPITRRRWPDGVAAQSFFEKNLPAWAPPWIRRVAIPTSDGSTTFPVLAGDDLAALVWLAAHSALELHTPQWRVDADGARLLPDRLVIDLDPGPPAGLADCARVAAAVREALACDGYAARAVLSGSKGLHLYADLAGGGALPPDADCDQVTEYVRTLATTLAREHPDEVVAVMTRSRRPGKVFLDWSQNRAAKTTLAPWSLRGSAEPFAAVPVSWDEVESGQLRQMRLSDALLRADQPQ